MSAAPTSKAVVITGAAGALGQVVVAEFVSCGWEVVALDRAGERLDALGSDPAVHPIAVDLAHQDTVAAAFEQADAVATPGALVSLAGGFKRGSLAEVDEAAARSLWDSNFASVLWCCQAVAPRLAAAGGGAIVTVGSRTARQGKSPVAHGPAKAAVLRLTEILAVELRPQRIRVNAVLPSVIDTPANRSWMSESLVARAVPPAAIAKVITFLCSDDAWPISGASIPVYGDS
jgi:NAD(P)-dependent dehydrogenase (short-subunit alcohol dehydrogenase family)